MNLRILGLVVSLVLTIVTAPVGSSAQTITVDFGPGICTLSGTSPLNFPNPYTCGNITITPRGGGSANVMALDGNSDIMRFLNATIAANSACEPPPGGTCNAVEDLHIVVTREFIPGPTTTAANVFYRTSASGNFSTTNVGNVVTVKSTVTEVATSTTQQMFLQQETDGQPNTPPNGNTISLPTAGTQNAKWLVPPHLSGNRILKLDFWFTLTNAGDRLNLASITLENRATSGDDGGGEGGGRPGH